MIDINKIALTPRYALLWLSLACIVALGFAYINEYYFGYSPCVLCIYQRIPFWVVFLVGLVGFLLNHSRITILALCASALALLINAGIAAYHSGVEVGIFKGTDSCGTSLPLEDSLSLEALKDSILSAPLTRCDEISWEFLGFSMANYNIVFCIMLATYAGFMIAKAWKVENDKKA